jgi:hypothetical protein
MPYVNVWVDDTELDEFEDDDLVAELQGRGYVITKTPVEPEGLERIEYLIAIGMYREARTETLQLVEAQLGRPNTISRAD